MKKDTKGNLNNLEAILKTFESHRVLKKSKKLSVLLKSSLFVKV